MKTAFFTAKDWTIWVRVYVYKSVYSFDCKLLQLFYPEKNGDQSVGHRSEIKWLFGGAARNMIDIFIHIYIDSVRLKVDSDGLFSPYSSYFHLNFNVGHLQLITDNFMARSEYNKH